MSTSAVERPSVYPCMTDQSRWIFMRHPSPYHIRLEPMWWENKGRGWQRRNVVRDPYSCVLNSTFAKWTHAIVWHRAGCSVTVCPVLCSEETFLRILKCVTVTHWDCPLSWGCFLNLRNGSVSKRIFLHFFFFFFSFADLKVMCVNTECTGGIWRWNPWCLVSGDH